jgi:hypothetical protein
VNLKGRKYPYCFVFIDACDTADNVFWSRAFGIMDKIAKAYLTATDSTFATRTWQHVLDEIICIKTVANQERWKVMFIAHFISAVFTAHTSKRQQWQQS